MIVKQKIIDCFNLGAKTYDAAADVQVMAALQLQTYLSSYPTQNILEIGCGTGLLSQGLIDRYPHALIDLTDISLEMVKLCQVRYQHHPSIRVYCMDGEKFVPKDTYDLIISNMTMHWFDDLKKSIHTMIAHLPTDGRLIFSLLGDQSLLEWQSICDAEKMNCGIPAFPAYDELRKYWGGIQFHVEKKVIHYLNGYAFLKTLKQLGAVATPIHYQTLTVSQLRKVLRQLDKPFSITYEIIYGFYQKP